MVIPVSPRSWQGCVWRTPGTRETCIVNWSCRVLPHRSLGESVLSQRIPLTSALSKSRHRCNIVHHIMVVICDANSIDRLLICHGISRNYITDNVILWDTTSISLFCPASLDSQSVMTFDYHLKLNSKDSTTARSASTVRSITNTESHSVIVKLDSVDTDQRLYTCKSS